MLFCGKFQLTHTEITKQQKSSKYAPKIFSQINNFRVNCKYFQMSTVTTMVTL